MLMQNLRAELESSHSVAEESTTRLVLRRHWLNYVFPGLLLALIGIPGAALLASGRGDDAQRIMLALWGGLCPLSGTAMALWGFFTRTQRIAFDKERAEARVGRKPAIPLRSIQRVTTVVKQHGTRDKRGRRTEVYHVELRTTDGSSVAVMNTLRKGHARELSQRIATFLGVGVS